MATVGSCGCEASRPELGLLLPQLRPLKLLSPCSRAPCLRGGSLHVHIHVRRPLEPLPPPPVAPLGVARTLARASLSRLDVRQFLSERASNSHVLLIRDGMQTR